MTQQWTVRVSRKSCPLSRAGVQPRVPSVPAPLGAAISLWRHSIEPSARYCRKCPQPLMEVQTQLAVLLVTAVIAG